MLPVMATISLFSSTPRTPVPLISTHCRQAGAGSSHDERQTPPQTLATHSWLGRRAMRIINSIGRTSCRGLVARQLYSLESSDAAHLELSTGGRRLPPCQPLPVRRTSY